MHGCSRLHLFRSYYSLYLLLSQLLIASLGAVPGSFMSQICSPHTGADRAHRLRQRIWFCLALLLPCPQRCGLTSLVTWCSALTWAPCMACLPQAVWEPMKPPDRPKGPGKTWLVHPLGDHPLVLGPVL